jgi:WD40 repeat protein
MRVLLAVLLVGIAGCGGSSPEQKAAAKKSVEGQQTLTLKGHSGTVISVSFSPDGKRIVSGSADKTVKVWDISSLDTPK